MAAQMINVDHGQVTTSSPQRKPPRLCRTPDECFAAGLADAANDPPLTESQRTRIAALLGPSIRAQVEANGATAERSDAA